ncbi:GntR family transcriptional regulator [Microterricola viridarii]|uniref:DNA-binding transcriptional regulator, GntR family n=1 Tax=Microterricola viridarii TaxID=412690 RepID=A0A1H1MD96_9MICO|nr:GntR family transcriptional regulator [Microterricola viridarii]SDR84562.1 DNA-binding transcriptional regulator, GntR family [Microterricola viridarii]
MAPTQGDADRPMRKPSRAVLSDETHDAIMGLLLNHHILPGAHINIDALARELEVSPTPVREALARLESENLVAKQPLRGYTATALLTASQVDELFQFRALIEPWAAGQAAARVSDADAEALRAELERGREAAEHDIELAYARMSEHDARFHELIAGMSGSEYVLEAFTRTHCHLHLFRLYQARKSLSDAQQKDGGFVDNLFGLYYQPASGFLALREHEAIADAVLSGDSARASELMLSHIEESRSRNAPAAQRLGGS